MCSLCIFINTHTEMVVGARWLSGRASDMITDQTVLNSLQSLIRVC